MRRFEQSLRQYLLLYFALINLCTLPVLARDNHQKKTTHIPISWALSNAASDGNDVLVKKLLNKGANVNWKSYPTNETALMCAIENNHLSTVRILIAAGADVNARQPLDDTPLGYAVDVQNPQIVETLLRHGANAKIISDTELMDDPMTRDLKKRNVAIAKLLIRMDVT